MNIILTEDQLAGLIYATSNFNYANGDEDISIEEFASNILGAKCNDFFIEKIKSAQEKLLQDERFVSICAMAASAPIEKQDAALNAALKELS